MIRALARAAFTATVAAGIVGVLRQHHEARAVRRGALGRATAASDVPPAARYGPIARSLATWVPDPPTTTVGRAAASVWAAPLTLAGLVLTALAGTAPRWDAERGCFVSRGARGPSRVALRAVGAQANTVGQIVLAVQEDPSPVLLAHEAVHVRQGERLGPLLFPLYVWLGARYGYRDHPLERAARLGARRWISAHPEAARPSGGGTGRSLLPG